MHTGDHAIYWKTLWNKFEVLFMPFLWMTTLLLLLFIVCSLIVLCDYPFLSSLKLLSYFDAKPLRESKMVFKTRILQCSRWQNQLNSKFMGLHFVLNEICCFFNDTNNKNLCDLLIVWVRVRTVRANVLLCSNVTFWNEWRVCLRFHVEFCMCFFMLVYIEWVLGILCMLFTFLI